jgi:hypothetical protein
MSFDKDLLDKIRILEETGQQFLDRLTALGEAEEPIDALDFHRWRVEASKLLYFSLGSSNYYYERFWKSVTRPELSHLQEGLRLLATVKSELQAVLPPEQPFTGPDKKADREVVLPGF